MPVVFAVMAADAPESDVGVGIKLVDLSIGKFHAPPHSLASCSACSRVTTGTPYSRAMIRRYA